MQHPDFAVSSRSARIRTPVGADAALPYLSAADALEGIDQSPAEALSALMASPDLCSRRWIWEQYDHMVMGDTVQRPGGDAAVVRVHGTDRSLAITTDCTPRYCIADPVEGGRQAVAEALAKPDGDWSEAARHHRQHEFRQPGTARNHGTVRRVHRRYG